MFTDFIHELKHFESFPKQKQMKTKLYSLTQLPIRSHVYPNAASPGKSYPGSRINNPAKGQRVSFIAHLGHYFTVHKKLLSTSAGTVVTSRIHSAQRTAISAAFVQHLHILLLVCGILIFSNAEALIVNGNFEDPPISANSVNTTSPITGWSKSGNVYIGNGNTVFSNPAPALGSQFLIFQNVGSISQTFSVNTATTYTLSLYAALRNCCVPQGSSLEVRLNGNLIGTVTPTVTNYVRFKVNLGLLSPGSHTLSLTSTQTLDRTIFLDGVVITQEDNDGIVEENDIDDDNDGILDVNEGLSDAFFWNNAPSISGTTATGTINGITYTYVNPGSNIPSGAGYANYYVFAASPFSSIPNHNPTIRNVTAGTKSITFSSPITNPVFVFGSIGSLTNSPWNGPANTPVSITFSSPVTILWAHTGNGSSTVQNNSTTITGTEGYAVVQVPGTHTTITFNYSTAENYVNFGFGANFQSTIDTDGDGYPNHLDTDSDNDGCPDVIEGGANFVQGASYITDNRLNTAVNASGVPSVPGGTTGYTQAAGQTVGGSTIATQLVVDAVPVDRYALPGSSTTFNISTTASNATSYSGTAPNTLPVYGTPGTANSETTYKWYLGNPDSSGTLLNDVGVYSGTNTATLGISNSTGLFGNRYFVVVTQNNNACLREVRSALLLEDCSVSAPSSTPSVCVNTAMPVVKHATRIASGIGTAVGLPTGVTANWANDTITISGTPSAIGVFNYSIPLTGALCSDDTAKGTITVLGITNAGEIAGNQRVCGGSAPEPFTSATLATGNGTITYQWQSSIDGGTNWTNIPGATNATYAAGAISQNTDFRRISFASGCQGVSSNVVSITVGIGTEAPLLTSGSNFNTNACPATTVDLTAIVMSNIPTGGSVSWHTGYPASAANAVANPTAVGAGFYYAVFKDDILADCYSDRESFAGTTLVVVTTNSCSEGTIDCSKTQIYPAAVEGTPAQLTLVVTVNVTASGCFTPLSVSGSGFSVANNVTEICTATTGIQQFSIPVNYDGSTLGTMNFTVGQAGSCAANLTITPKEVCTDIWTLDCLPTAGPTLR